MGGVAVVSQVSVHILEGHRRVQIQKNCDHTALARMQRGVIAVSPCEWMRFSASPLRSVMDRRSGHMSCMAAARVRASGRRLDSTTYCRPRRFVFVAVDGGTPPRGTPRCGPCALPFGCTRRPKIALAHRTRAITTRRWPHATCPHRWLAFSAQKKTHAHASESRCRRCARRWRTGCPSSTSRRAQAARRNQSAASLGKGPRVSHAHPGRRCAHTVTSR